MSADTKNLLNSTGMYPTYTVKSSAAAGEYAPKSSDAASTPPLWEVHVLIEEGVELNTYPGSAA